MKGRASRTVQPIRFSSERNELDKYFRTHSPRNRVLFNLGIFTGRRISDLVNLNVRDVAYIDKRGRLCVRERLEIREQKTRKFAGLILHQKLKGVLSKYLRERRKHSETLGALLNEPLLKSQKPRRNGEYRITRRQALRILSDGARACGITYRIGTHSLRKTFGYILYQQGKSIELIQKLLNHASPAITLAYIGITSDDMDEAILDMEF